EPLATAPPPPQAPPIAAGFCDPDDSKTFYEIHHTLRGLLAKRPSAEAAALVREALDTEKSDPERHLEAVRRARVLLPRDPALGWAIAAATRQLPDLDEAIEGLGDYLAADPSPDLARLKALLEVQRDIHTGYQRLERGGTTLMWPRDALTLVQVDELLYTVNRALDEAAQLTGTERRRKLTVVAYPGHSELLAVTCTRAWTAAVYDGTLRVVLSQKGGGADLKIVRHETLHAQVSRFANKAPRWFHEGLAQSFAQQTDRKRGWPLMVKNKVWIPFTSLDGSFQAFEQSEDASLAYVQSYAMAELMRDCGGDAAISRAIDGFQAGETTDAVLQGACGRPVTGEQLLEFMARPTGAQR
ncbi:MAG: hypothetical protein JNK82_31330, partial [Myxococcaceae bacterium]|nr:hypothetical protein [Myxococcaceae bacterium]